MYREVVEKERIVEVIKEVEKEKIVEVRKPLPSLSFRLKLVLILFMSVLLFVECRWNPKNWLNRKLPWSQ